MSAKGMQLTVLVTGLIEAHLKDEAPEAGGFDITAGMIGPNVSNWLRSVANDYSTAERQAALYLKLVNLCGHVANSSETVVTISQDDACRTFHLKVGKNTYWGNSLADAINKASDAENQDDEL